MKGLQKLLLILLIGVIFFGVRIVIDGELIPTNNDDVEVLGHTSSWLYRRAIELENEEEENLRDTEVLITLNTQDLINSGKLLENCNDIRFLDNDNSTLLRHRIESGCNTEQTDILIILPSLPKDGTLIYFYYGNPYVPNLEF